MGWKEFTRAYFTFTRKDVAGISVALVLISFVCFSPALFRNKNNTPHSTTDTAWIAAVKKLEKKEAMGSERDVGESNEGNSLAYQYDRSSNAYFAPVKAELFYFNPNTLPADGWQKLGIRDRTIKTIQNYLSKGGHFYKPEDLSKIYGLRKEEYERLEPYIRIEGKQPGATTFRQSETNMPVRTERYRTIDINTADTTAFIALPGIGSKLAARIVNVRDKLGGFYSISQVAETFGLPDSTFQKIRQYLTLENPSVKKININTATVDELKAHPYIRFSIANPIVAYRNEHGPFAKVEEIKKVMVVTEEVYQKIEPYLTIQ